MQHPRAAYEKHYLNSTSEGKGFLDPWMEKKRIYKGVNASCSQWHIWALQAKPPWPVTWVKQRQQPCLCGHQTCVPGSNRRGCLRCLLVNPLIHICAVGVHVREQSGVTQASSWALWFPTWPMQLILENVIQIDRKTRKNSQNKAFFYYSTKAYFFFSSWNLTKIMYDPVTAQNKQTLYNRMK